MADGSIAVAPANLRTTCSASIFWSPTRSIRRSRNSAQRPKPPAIHSRSTSFSAICIARKARSAARSRSTSSCCSDRTCVSSNTPTSCSASASTTNMADSWIARSRLSPRCCASIRRIATRCRTWKSCTRSSTSGPTPTRCGRSSRPGTSRSSRPGTRRSSRSSKTRLGWPR